MGFDSRGEFPDQDRALLELTSKTDWVPPDPADLIAPYMEKMTEEEKKDSDSRLYKARQVMDGYGKIIERCAELKADIEEKCKDVKVTLDPSQNKDVLDAARRFFRRDVQEITFEMYKTVVHAIANSANENTPGPGGLDGTR